MTEVVRFTGGWLFDQGMAGWDVTVLRSDHADPRPLRILGARVASLEPVLAAPVRGPRSQAVAVHAELYDSDPRVRRMVHDAVDDMDRVWTWGHPPPAEPGEGAGAVRHRLSLAARAFKAQALAAAAAPDAGEGTTELLRGVALLRSSNGT
ncbi:hypothetical protein E1200_13875 [Actinomadura sp. GC306]|uniref:hypothetical protein n=1 Tax=Actinomadura sp. GC306 TaxID=2530367 RepID=UPI001050738B|nr:hypothetical protein [Actinomadura sp. GC306]TDC67746.1 hypothetical protein E1200_13875 [Actinomadura sp. GC306]